MNRATTIKARSIIIQSIKIRRRMINVYATRRTHSKNVHTSSNSIEKEDERRTKMSETK
jgi:hypothetical protein